MKISGEKRKKSTVMIPFYKWWANHAHERFCNWRSAKSAGLRDPRIVNGKVRTFWEKRGNLRSIRHWLKLPEKFWCSVKLFDLLEEIRSVLTNYYSLFLDYFLCRKQSPSTRLRLARKNFPIQRKEFLSMRKFVGKWGNSYKKRE